MMLKSIRRELLAIPGVESVKLSQIQVFDAPHLNIEIKMFSNHTPFAETAKKIDELKESLIERNIIKAVHLSFSPHRRVISVAMVEEYGHNPDLSVLRYGSESQLRRMLT